MREQAGGGSVQSIGGTFRLMSDSPRLWRWLIYAAGWMAPAAARADWRSRWDSRLQNLYILMERGHVPAHLPGYASILCRDAFVNACRLRFAPIDWGSWPRSAGFLMCSAFAIVALTAVGSHGFRNTRSLVDAAASWVEYPVPRLPNMARAPYDPRANRVIAHMIPLMLALATSVVMVLIGRLPRGRYGWRYWVFLAGKTVAVMAIVPVWWIEGGAAVRARIPNQVLSMAIGGVALTLVFIAAFGAATVWVVADQRLRCPICLRRLAMPVAIGSWASTFEPPATELLCEVGHGSLCVSESAGGEPDRWVALDDSWQVAG
jgi:hypothetical protein